MATAHHNLSLYDIQSVPSAEAMRFGIVVSEWNENITAALLRGAVDTLLRHGAKQENIVVKTVPGSFELVYGASQFIECEDVDAIIAIGSSSGAKRRTSTTSAKASRKAWRNSTPRATCR